MPIFARKHQRSTRSPLKSEPLRNPGESLTDEFDRLLYDHVAGYFLVMAAFASFGACELIFAILKTRPSPIITIPIAGLIVAYSGYQIWRTMPELKRLRLGISGEKAVGQFLDNLRSQAYSVFHDIVSDHGNIDHALVGPGGVFAIETKTISKPTEHDAVVSYDGTTVRVDGFSPDRDPVAQSLAASRDLAQIIEKGTQRNHFVRPVVLYPGWFVEKQPKAVVVWVLAPRAFAAFLQHEKVILTEVEIAAIRAVLEAHIRTSEAVRKSK